MLQLLRTVEIFDPEKIDRMHDHPMDGALPTFVVDVFLIT
jgi:hypothetical protein